MGELTFKGLKVDELDLTNKIEGQVELDISQRASFNVKYSNDNLHCMANLTIDMMEKTHHMLSYEFPSCPFLPHSQIML